MKILSKREIREIAISHSSDTEFQEFLSLYKQFIKEKYSFLVNYTTLSLDNHLHFRKYLLE